MNLLLTDMQFPDNLPICSDNHYIDLSKEKIASCMGCFGCWVKTPGRCVIRDDATKVYSLIAKCDRLIYVSRIYCGSYDVPMKTMLERAIPVQQAFIRLHNGETHHVQRNVVDKDVVIIAYGDSSEEERDIFKKLVARNANNMSFKNWKILFVEEGDLNHRITEEVKAWKNS